jgi:hypothetical protein
MRAAKAVCGAFRYPGVTRKPTQGEGRNANVRQAPKSQPNIEQCREGSLSKQIDTCRG